jgi:hypothetical protein
VVLFVIAAILPVVHVLVQIMQQVAALAKCSQVPKTIVLFVAVDMGNSQNNFAPGQWVRLIIFRAAFLTMVFSTAYPDQPANQFPLGVI